ncbi:Uncharacterised protein [Streptococcus pneumoniae]|nr:Uncharacterised protein [Streptococcus pneumoniae]
MYLVIEIVLAFIVSFWKDNRSLWNPVLFLLSLISSYFYYPSFQVIFIIPHFKLFLSILPFL